MSVLCCWQSACRVKLDSGWWADSRGREGERRGHLSGPHPQTQIETFPDASALRWALTYLDEGKQKAHSKIGQPVHGAGDHEGSRAVRLLKQLAGQNEGDSTWRGGQETRSVRVVWVKNRVKQMVIQKGRLEALIHPKSECCPIYYSTIWGFRQACKKQI